MRSRSASLRASRPCVRNGPSGGKAAPTRIRFAARRLNWGTGDHKDGFSFAPETELAARLLLHVRVGCDVLFHALDVAHAYFQVSHALLGRGPVLIELAVAIPANDAVYMQ